MRKLSTLGDIRDSLQLLERETIRWLKLAPSAKIEKSLHEAREKMKRCLHLCENSLKVALLGEVGSEKTSLLGAFLHTPSFCNLREASSFANVLEVHVHLRSAATDPPHMKLIFLQPEQVWRLLDTLLDELVIAAPFPERAHSLAELPALESRLQTVYQRQTEALLRQKVLDVAEYIQAIKNYLCFAGEQCELPQNLLSAAVATERIAETDWQNFCAALQRIYGSTLSPQRGIRDASSVRGVFPLIQRVIVEITLRKDTWPMDHTEGSELVFCEFPNLCREMSSRAWLLALEQIKESHAILAVLNAQMPSSGDLLFQMLRMAGDPVVERTMLAANRFDEFLNDIDNLSARSLSSNFARIATSAARLRATRKQPQQLYVCSALCYLSEMRERQDGRWQEQDWSTGKERQYAQYREINSTLRKLARELMREKFPVHEMRLALESYVESAGINALRNQLLVFSREKGKKLVREEALKEFRTIYRLLDRIAPKTSGYEDAISREVTYAAQDFYRTIEQAITDSLPGGSTDYKNLYLRGEDRDIPLWDAIEREIASRIAVWPEWSTAVRAGGHPHQQPARRLDRYSWKESTSTLPEEFSDFDQRLKDTAVLLCEYVVGCIREAIRYSIERFEQHPDYQDSCKAFQAVLDLDKVMYTEEALPLRDAWKPTSLVGEYIVPEIVERIREEIESLKDIRYPYDRNKRCMWNLALVIRIQVQLLKTLRDRISRLIASAEAQFQSFFVDEVLRGEIIPRVRTCINDVGFMVSVSKSQLSPSDTARIQGSSLRRAVEEVKNRDEICQKQKNSPNSLQL